MSVVYRVINQKLYRHNPREVIATNQFGFVEVEVRFEGWDDYENKRIQFIQKDRILNRLLVDNKCYLPMELAVGMFQVTVIGTQPNGMRATTQVLCDLIVASGYQEGGDPPVPPTPDLYAQLLQSMDTSIEKSVPKIGENDHWFVWSAELGEYTDTGVTAKGGSLDPEALADAVEKYLSEHPIQEKDPTVPEWAKKTLKPKVSEWENDAGYLTEYTESDPTVPSWAKNPDKPTYTVSEISGAASSEELEEAKETLQSEISAVDAIARGKSRARVFATKQAMLNWLQDSSHVAELAIGDNFYIKATDTPDYWWDGTQVQELESEKVDLTDYATKEELKTEKERAEQVEDDLLSNIHALQAKQPIEVVNLDGSMTPSQVASLPNGLYYFVKPVQRMNGTYSCQGLCSISEDTVNNFDYGHFFNDFNGQVYAGYGAIDGFGLEEAQEAISALEEQIKELELYKFPNAVIIGSPIINHGQVSGFSAENYLRFPFLVDFQNRAFTINMAFTTGSNVTTQQNIIDSAFGLAFAIKDGKFLIAISTNGTSWNLGAHSGTYSVQPNTSYKVRVSWNRIQYKVEYSLDGTNYYTDISLAQTASPYPRQITIGVGDLNAAQPHPFGGIIDLNYSDLYVSGDLVWQGMDDVGLATRAAIDLSNIDAAGVQRILNILATVYAPQDKTAAMTQPVGKDGNGKLWTTPGGGSSVTVDPTLSISGAAADAKVVGDRLGGCTFRVENGILYIDYDEGGES